jgi:hypothetical protein
VSALTTVINGAGLDRVFEVRPGGDLTLVDLTVQGGNGRGSVGAPNPAGLREGGGIKVGLEGVGAGALTLTRVVLQNNSAPTEEGGGFFAASGSTVTMVDSTVRLNQADSGGGGNIRDAGTTLTVMGSTFSNNTALSVVGGGLRINSDAVARLTNATISGNSARRDGGGILVEGGGSVTLASSTVAGNAAGTSVASNGGGVAVGVGSPSATLRNTILAGNMASNVGPDCFGSVTSDGYNLVQNAANCTFSGGTGDQTGVDPLLGSLASNGGNSQTRALTTGSPAVDAGNPAGCTDALGGPLTTDQRGLARPQGTRCDIGADEALRLAISDVSQAEGDSGSAPFTFAVTLSEPVPVGFPSVTVEYSTAVGGASPATAGSDYTPVGATPLTFNPGDASKNAVVTVAGDTMLGVDESFLVNLANAAGAAIVDGQALGTILNDDTSPPAVTTSSGSLAYTQQQPAATVDPGLAVTNVESGSLAGATVRLAAGYQQGQDVLACPACVGLGIAASFAPATGTLSLSGAVSASTYQTALRSVTFSNAGESPSATDRTASFQVTYAPTSVASNVATRGIQVASGPTLTIGDVRVEEGDAGTKAATFSVSLTPASSNPVTVQVRTQDGSATAGSDYTALPPTTLTFAPGETSKSVNVTVNGDTAAESDEAFTVALSGATGASIARATATGFIGNDDSPNPQTRSQPVFVQGTREPGRLQVGLQADTSVCPSGNSIQRIEFGVARNARVEVPGAAPGTPGGPSTTPGGPNGTAGNFTLMVNAASVSFIVQRQGPGDFKVDMAIYDTCNAAGTPFRTFVGGGVGVP